MRQIFRSGKLRETIQLQISPKKINFMESLMEKNCKFEPDRKPEGLRRS